VATGDGNHRAAGKLKVAVVTSFPTEPDSPRGGVEAVSVNLCDALSQFDDLEIHAVTFVPGPDATGRYLCGKVHIHRLPSPGGFVLVNAVTKGRRLICDYIERLSPDVVHAHDTYGLMVTPLRVPRVFTIHGFIYGDTLVNGGRFAGLRSRIWKIVETGDWARQPHIISISPYVRERLAGIANGIIHDIDNPISDGFFRLQRKERKGVIFSAAVISPRKNTLNLVEGFIRFLEKGNDGELRLAGAVVEPRYGEKVRERVHVLGLEEKIRFLGRIPMPEIREELAQASVFALTSLEENSPMGIEEAMAAGVPVVTSNRCGMPYMVRHGESGYLVDPGDPGDIARRLGRIITDDGLRNRMSERSVEIARDRFHPEAVARRTREVYYEAAGLEPACSR
jgi:glycosyltransferase involved in cell wall biosynthesis